MALPEALGFQAKARGAEPAAPPDLHVVPDPDADQKALAAAQERLDAAEEAVAEVQETFDESVAEVEKLLERNLDPQLPVMRAIGVREITAFLCGELTKAQAIDAGQQATRRYAKRQYTWFSHQPPADWRRFTDPLEGLAIDHALALLRPAE